MVRRRKSCLQNIAMVGLCFKWSEISMPFFGKALKEKMEENEKGHKVCAI
jgi:hypothetical protein